MTERGPFDGQDLVEIYAASNELEAQRIVMMLEDEGIEALFRAMSTTMSFPAPVEAHYLITVREEHLAKAVAALEAARADGELGPGGTFLTDG